MQQMWKLKDQRGSATVEVSILMGLLMSVLLLSIYMFMGLIDMSTTEKYTEMDCIRTVDLKTTGVKTTENQNQLKKQLIFCNLGIQQLEYKNNQIIEQRGIDKDIPVMGALMKGQWNHFQYTSTVIASCREHYAALIQYQIARTMVEKLPSQLDGEDEKP